MNVELLPENLGKIRLTSSMMKAKTRMAGTFNARRLDTAYPNVMYAF
jgi:hypothetical protein